MTVKTDVPDKESPFPLDPFSVTHHSVLSGLRVPCSSLVEHGTTDNFAAFATDM